jgi:hypothetical protein
MQKYKSVKLIMKLKDVLKDDYYKRMNRYFKEKTPTGYKAWNVYKEVFLPNGRVRITQKYIFDDIQVFYEYDKLTQDRIIHRQKMLKKLNINP